MGRFSGLGICSISNSLCARYGGKSEAGEVVGDRLNAKTKAAVITRQSSHQSPDVLLNPLGLEIFSSTQAYREAPVCK